MTVVHRRVDLSGADRLLYGLKFLDKVSKSASAPIVQHRYLAAMWNSSQTMSDPHSSGAPSLRLEPSIAACHLPSHSSIRIQPLRCKRALQFAKVSAAIDIIKSSPIQLLSTSYQKRPQFRCLLGRSAHSLIASPALREEVRNLWLPLSLPRKKDCKLPSYGQLRARTTDATGWQVGRLAGWQAGRLAGWPLQLLDSCGWDRQS